MSRTYFDTHAEDRPIAPRGATEDAELSPEEAFLLSQCDGRLRLRDLAHVVPGGPGELGSLVRRLRGRGLLEWVEGETASPSRHRTSTHGVGSTARRVRAEPTPAGTDEDEEKEAAAQLDQLRRRVSVQRRLIDKGDPFEVLQVKPGSTDDEVRDAFRRLSRTFHPDRYYHLDLDGELKREIEDIYGELQNAYSYIGTKEARRSYLQEQQRQRLRDSGQPTPSRQPRTAGAGRIAELAQTALDKGQYDSASTNFRLAHQMSPGSGYGDKAKLVELLQKVEERIGVFTSEEEVPHPDEVAQLTDMIGRIEPILPPAPRIIREMILFLLMHAEDFALMRTLTTRLLTAHRSVENLLLAARVYIDGDLAQTALDTLGEVKSKEPGHPELKELTRRAKKRL